MADLTKVKKSVMEESQILPDMSGQSGMLLSNNGSMPVWVAGRIIGEICRFSFDNPPPGFFALDGSTITNGKIDFPALASSGSRFITISGNNIVLKNFVDFGRGKGSSGRSVGSFEDDAIRNIYGWVRATGGFTEWGSMQYSGVFYGSDKNSNTQEGGYNNVTDNETIHFDASRVVPTADQNRPKSLTELVCIYHGVL